MLSVPTSIVMLATCIFSIVTFATYLSRLRNEIISPNGVRLVFHYCIFFFFFFFLSFKSENRDIPISEVFEGLKTGCPGKIGTLGRYAKFNC